STTCVLPAALAASRPNKALICPLPRANITTEEEAGDGQCAPECSAEEFPCTSRKSGTRTSGCAA
ncbi:MAG: hypothetical protein OSB60_12395, partial [Myxococcota bacterium]|nr:hypothetical protein [Myxococcota bacterium]